MKVKRLKRTDAIDWREVHRRLTRAAAATERALSLTSEHAKAVMEERARALARVPVQAHNSTDVLEFVTFTLANERYGIESRHVWEVVRCTDCTPVPAAPDFLVGVLNLRGDMLAVFDLRKLFNVTERGPTDLCRILILGDERAEFGVLADSVHDLITLRTDEMLEPPESVVGIGREFLRGVTQDVLIVLDGRVLFQDSRLFIDQSEGEGA